MSADPRLEALALPGGDEPTGESPLSPAPPEAASATDAAPQESDLGDLAFGFLNATDPESASAYLLEFLEEAGFSRRSSKK